LFFLFAVCWTKQTRRSLSFGSGSFENRLARFGLLAQEPIVSPPPWVVMPMCIEAATCSKLVRLFIPDEQGIVQI